MNSSKLGCCGFTLVDRPNGKDQVAEVEREELRCTLKSQASIRSGDDGDLAGEVGGCGWPVGFGAELVIDEDIGEEGGGRWGEVF